MKSIVSEENIKKLSSSRKILGRIAVGIVIAGVVLGALMILAGTDGGAFGSVVGTMISAGLALVSTSIALRLLESKKPVPQIFGIIGGIFGLIWALVSIINAWMPQATYSYCGGIFEDGCIAGSAMTKIVSITGYLTLFGLICGGIMNMYEGKRKDIILPLKITSAVLIGFELLYSIVVTMIGRVTNERIMMLAVFAMAIWVIVIIITAVMSKNEKKRDKGTLRQEIEDQVRREMIEKEVREEYEKKNEDEKKDEDENVGA